MRIDPTLAMTVAAVVEEGTLDAAARRLHLTPSAVSQRIKLVEEQLGQRVLVRSKPVRATQAGEVVTRYAHRVALVEHDATQALGLSEDVGRRRLALGVTSDSLATWLLPPLARFADRHDVELDLVRRDQEQTAGLLEDGQVVAAVTSRRDPVPGCRMVELGAMTFEAMASPAWVARWAPDGVTSTSLQDGPRIDFDRSDTLQLEWLRHHGVDGSTSPHHLVPSTHDITQAVELGLGWGVIPTDQATDLADQGRLVRLGGPQVSTALYWQCWKDEVTLLAALTQEVVAAARSELSEA
ncbi:hypothetical protein ASD11_06625 [Aeromicrobium sp. Root495]|uniref:LysR family transcriptional regulator ArgP n=1 Tax=Aeromicrobium sp. Root495 TaxID=1736550 RepID=UPI00070170A1|nr:LysR family transcriptional regulator ArgP [Aeromicrobium sp. Root495]KQY59250.1 hypothetical protein ASD11_06625 [Aeromicrobium sp. Root495]